MLHCPDCKKEFEFSDGLPEHHFNDKDKVIFDVFCNCGGRLEAGFSSGKFSRNSTGQNTYYSKALGVHPSQIKDEMTRHPSWRFRGDGALEVRGYADQRNKLKQLGMVDLNDAKD
jgi:hypothetical protein